VSKKMKNEKKMFIRMSILERSYLLTEQLSVKVKVLTIFWNVIPCKATSWPLSIHLFYFRTERN